MSGGSYDYACYEMSDGRVDKATRNLDFAIEDFDKMASADPPTTTYDWAVVDGKRTSVDRPLTADERTLADAGVAALRRRLHKFAELMRSASAEAKELSDLFRTLEWFRSGDYSENALYEHAREWATKRLNDE